MNTHGKLYREGLIEDVYYIEEECCLGEGGSGVVKKGEHIETGNPVAIKIIDK